MTPIKKPRSRYVSRLLCGLIILAALVDTACAQTRKDSDVCCTVIVIDGEQQVIYARHQETGEVIQFQVDVLDIRSVRIGDMVGATFDQDGVVVTSLAGADRNYTSVVPLADDWQPTHSFGPIPKGFEPAHGGAPQTDGSEVCCTMAPNPELKGVTGRLVVQAIKGVASFTVEVFKAGTTTTWWYGNKAVDLLPDTYDVVVNGVKLENVKVGRRMDTRIRMGALRINLSDGSTWEVFDTSKQKTLDWGYGSTTIALPVGTYSIKIAGGFLEANIQEDKVFTM